MKDTAFVSFHNNLKARMTDYAGYNMPIEYSGIKDEHVVVREKLGVFDVSHMGEFWVKGEKAFEFVQKVTSNNISDLVPGKIQYSCFPNNNGGIVDDLLVYMFDEMTYLLVVNASNIEKDWKWCSLQASIIGLEIGKELYNASDEISQLAVQGPLAIKAMQKLTSYDITNMPQNTFKKIDFAGIKNVVFSITGYTGAGGCEIYIANSDASKLWKSVFDAGEELGIKPIGLGARDTLRLEAGFCLYGNELNDETSAIEAGLGWISKFVEGNNFIQRQLWQEQKENGVSKLLKGFVMQERGIPRQHYIIFNNEGDEIGEVTSGTMSPLTNKGIGLAYIKKGYRKAGSEIFIQIRNKKIRALITKPPFYNS